MKPKCNKYENILYDGKKVAETCFVWKTATYLPTQSQ